MSLEKEKPEQGQAKGFLKPSVGGESSQPANSKQMLAGEKMCWLPQGNLGGRFPHLNARYPMVRSAEINVTPLRAR